MGRNNIRNLGFLLLVGILIVGYFAYREPTCDVLVDP
jgi:hypothetical protein